MTEPRPGWAYRGIHLKIHQDLHAAAHAYMALVRSAKADGTLIQHRPAGMSVDLVDGRTVKFISRADASRPQGWAIASFDVSDGVELSDDARGLLIAATSAAGRSFCHRCEKVHAYCECDAYADLLTHSAHPDPSTRPHPMGE